MKQYIVEYLRVCALTPFFGAAILSTEKTLDTKLSCCLHGLSRTTGVLGTTWQAKKGSKHLTRCTKSK